MNKRLWNKSELYQALRLYCVTPFGKLHAKNPSIIELANKLERSANAVALKLVNFASLDPTIEQKGMGNVSKLDREVWTEFFAEFDSIAIEPTPDLPGFAEKGAGDFDFESAPGVDVLFVSTRRINQDFFRKLVLASYDSKCAVSGMTAPELMVAGHIVPWSHNAYLRTDPTNGICLNSLFDRAFDRGLITFDHDYRLRYSSKLPLETVQKMKGMASEKLIFPSRFRPGQQHFEYHRDVIFRP